MHAAGLATMAYYYFDFRDVCAPLVQYFLNSVPSANVPQSAERDVGDQNVLVAWHLILGDDLAEFSSEVGFHLYSGTSPSSKADPTTLN